MEAKCYREMWHDQREKPNNLKLVQQTKALIHNQLVDKAKARLPTFSHNLHLVVHYISLTLKNIHQITTCRLFEKKASLPDISMGKSTELLKTRQDVTAETLTADRSILTAETLTQTVTTGFRRRRSRRNCP